MKSFRRERAAHSGPASLRWAPARRQLPKPYLSLLSSLCLLSSCSNSSEASTIPLSVWLSCAERPCRGCGWAPGRPGCRQPPSDLPHRCLDTHPVWGRPEAVGQGHTPLAQRETPRLAGPRPVIQEGGKTGTPLLGDAQGGHTPAQDSAEQEHREKRGKSRESPTGHSGEKGSSGASKVWWGYVTISVTWSGLDFCGGGLNHTLTKDGGPSPCIFV